MKVVKLEVLLGQAFGVYEDRMREAPKSRYTFLLILCQSILAK